MDQNQNIPPVKRKHFSTVWSIIIIAVLSAIAGGVIVWVAFNSRLSDDISSMVLIHHKPRQPKTLTPTNSTKYNTASSTNE